MNAPRIEILAPGAYASVQDAGRRGFRRIGVPWSGVLDPRLMRIANTLVGNPETHAVIECFDGGLVLAARAAAIRVAVTGDAVIELEMAGERRPVAPWRSTVLTDGELLRVRKLAGGRIAMVAIEGLDLPKTLGSVSTYARAGLGGIHGRVLAAGMQLPVVKRGGGVDRVLTHLPTSAPSPIRVVLGPQADHFSTKALSTLIGADYRISTEADRMGIRLEGPVLEHAGDREIVSDATVPGSIQVPGSGQPIVLLADAQTAGGYPKIATVISADLPRLAACRPGQQLRFASVDATEAEEIARITEAETRTLIAAICPLLPDGVDPAALYSANLVGGVVHALSPEHRPQGWAGD